MYKVRLKTFFFTLFGICTIFFWSCSSLEKQPLVEKPNVLFIAIDDLNDWSEVLYGHPDALTPNLNAFKKEAVNFSRNYCASPGCNPSRSAVLTGLHTFNSGMYSNYQDWRKVPAFQDLATLPQLFRQNGYYTAGAGKIYHYSQVDSLGWEDYYPSQKQNMPRELMPDERPVNMPPFKYMYGMFDWAPLDANIKETGDFKSVDYVGDLLTMDYDKPFFLACGVYRPHLPWYVPKEYFDKFPLDSIQMPSIKDDDLDDLGNRAKELITRGGNYHKHITEANKWKEAVQAYLASVAYADDMVGLLLDNLKNSDYADNTIVVIWSDHGWQLGEKQHWRKFALWENVIRTLLMIKVPEGIEALPEGSYAGKEISSPTSLLDIYPTLKELCNLNGRDDLYGSSLVQQLGKKAKNVDRSVITTYDYGDYSIRKDKWHYIQYIDGSLELYNLENDPEEWENLAYLPEFQKTIEELSEEIPEQRIQLPEESLIELMEHHVPPVISEEFYYSTERKNWLQRFNSN